MKVLVVSMAWLDNPTILESWVSKWSNLECLIFDEIDSWSQTQKDKCHQQICCGVSNSDIKYLKGFCFTDNSTFLQVPSHKINTMRIFIVSQL